MKKWMILYKQWPLEETGLFINEAKKQNAGFPWMLLVTLGAILLANLLPTGKGAIRVGKGTVS